MKRKLEEFTISEFIRLIDGDLSVLGEPDVKEEEIPNIVRDIVLEYRSIIDPAGTRGYIDNTESYSRARNTALFFSICSMLVDMEQYKRVKELMNEYGTSFDKFSESRIKAEVKSRLAKAKNTLKRLDEEKTEDGDNRDIRRNFDEQTAALMAHFKFQIDMNTMRATLYAHLVARYNREIKAQLKALKK